jgi:hypothetical protein
MRRWSPMRPPPASGRFGDAARNSRLSEKAAHRRPELEDFGAHEPVVERRPRQASARVDPDATMHVAHADRRFAGDKPRRRSLRALCIREVAEAGDLRVLRRLRAHDIADGWSGDGSASMSRKNSGAGPVRPRRRGCCPSC